jgi:hypothetical protein
MNHITRLTTDLEEAREWETERSERVAEFRRHLASPKFGPQADGERGDLISTADVARWLDWIERRP